MAAGVDRGWFELVPEPPPPLPDEPALAARLSEYEHLGLPSWYEWNRWHLENLACELPEDFDRVYGRHTDLFVFDPPRPVGFPTFRFLRRAAYPSRLVTNAYGWRGPEVDLNKPARTVRVAFAGASTTMGFHGSLASYPEYVGRWLNEWAKAVDQDVRFEILNAAREGINSNSIAEVVRQELVPMEPDLVVYYEGSNQFWPAAFLEWPGGAIPERPRLDPRRPCPAERYSLLLARLRPVWDGLAGRWAETDRPELTVRWPADLDEHDPDLDHPTLLLNLPVILGDLESMRRDLEENGGELLVSTFFWMAYDGMRLDPVRNGNVLHYLRRAFGPFSYAHLERRAAFQNRAFAKYAETHDVPLLDFAAAYPRDPDLFADAIHMTPGGGTRLQAWVMLQLLLPVIERRLESGILPRPDRQPLDRHPAFLGDPRQLVPVPAILDACSP